MTSIVGVETPSWPVLYLLTCTGLIPVVANLFVLEDATSFTSNSAEESHVKSDDV